MRFRCSRCDKLVNANKPIIGSLHLCLTDEQVYAKQAFQAQQNYRTPEWMQKLSRSITESPTARSAASTDAPNPPEGKERL